MTTATTLARLTADEEAVLRSWLGGNTLTEIAKGRHTDAGAVGRIIDRLCNFDRPLGRRILESGEYEPFVVPAPKPVSKQVPKHLVSPPPPPPAEPVVKSNAVLDALAAPEPDPEPEPEPPAAPVPAEPEPEPEEAEPEPLAPAAAGDQALIRQADKLIARAEQIGTPDLRRIVRAIRELLAELVAELDQAEVRAAARALVEQKRRELEAAEERLRAVTGQPDPAKVRAWARAAGVYVHPHGTPSKAVVEQYKTALAREAAS